MRAEAVSTAGAFSWAGGLWAPWAKTSGAIDLVRKEEIIARFIISLHSSESIRRLRTVVTIAHLVLSRYYETMQSDSAERVAALIERIGRLITADAHEEGLQPVQWEALRYLTRANRFSKTAAALTAYLGLTKGTVSQTLKVLEAKELLCKHVDRKDRRSNRLSLTPKAQRLMRNDPLVGIQRAIDALPASTRRLLARGLEAVLSNRLAARNRQPFGDCRDCRYFGRNHPLGRPHFCQLLGEKLSASESNSICFEQVPKR